MRRSAFLVVTALALIAGACGGDDDSTTTATATVAPTESVTAAPTSEPTSAPTEAATATSTAEPIPTLPLAPVAGQRFAVMKVRQNDSDGGLNLRSEPNAGSETLAVIPFNASDLVSTGQMSSPGDVSLWFEMTYDGVTGWANGVFLVPVPSFEELACDPADTDFTFGGELPPPEGDSDPAADHVLAMHQYEGGGCQRTVITFGRDFDFDADLAGALLPAIEVPEGLAVTVDLASFEVSLPDSVIAAATTATESFQLEEGLADLLFFRRATFEFGVAALFEANRGARVTTRSNPGQLVIDTIDAPTGSGLNLAPLSGGLTVLRHPINVDANGPSPEPPIVVSGFARPFEASGVAVLRTVPLEGDPPGSGDPVTADWSGGVLGDTCDSQYGFMTTDYIEAWGSFEFTIEALAPGAYELFVGEFSAQDGSEQGVYHLFTVGGSTAASC